MAATRGANMPMTATHILACVLLSISSAPVLASTKRPHILLVLADDYGWDNIGYHRATAPPPADPTLAAQAAAEVHTPNLDRLAAEGVKLERHYTYSICGPSRASLQSGRLAIHVNAYNTAPTVWNPADPVSGYAGIPRNMTGMATKMQQAGYRTAMVGKWDAGMATPEHTPQGRGYEEWYGYYQHANHYWTKGLGLQSTGEIDLCLNHFLDLSESNATYRGGVTAKADLDSSCKDDTSPDPACYEERLFRDRALAIIDKHEPTEAPLFLFYAFHLLHTPLLVPLATLKALDDAVVAAGGQIITDQNRRLYAAMTMYMDDVVGQLSAKLQSKGMWNDTLLVFMSDNGGPVYEPGAANNHPHRAGKYSDFDGGVRTNAFVSGGFVPSERRGTEFEGVVSIADWYSTFCGLAGIDPTDHAAAAANPWLEQHNLPTLPQIDSIDQWAAIMADVNARNASFALSADSVFRWPYKLVTGQQAYGNLYTGPLFPNCSTVAGVVQNGPVFVGLKIFDKKLLYSTNVTEEARASFTHDCGKAGCLFNVQEDPTEHNDLASDTAHADVLKELQSDLAQVKIFNPDRGVTSAIACQAGIENGGYYGPFVDIEGYYTNVQAPSVAKKILNAAYMKEVDRFNDTDVQVKCVAEFQKVVSSKVGQRLFLGTIDKCVNASNGAHQSGRQLLTDAPIICDIF